ncbi:hypothetical protein AOQ84DRAFT_372506 [Glonium stellatum]|uniref:Uncharacterized protein n=1 Tax=Glonium stellatum TaxID=574774 RepID=A0A8E2F9T3_9PEZI|nr:hypothetical protein AOQ84DRAFT_372506 [Glonium stellatum]
MPCPTSKLLNTEHYSSLTNDDDYSFGCFSDLDDDGSPLDGFNPMMYRSDCERLPEGAPINHMHLLDLSNFDEETDISNLRIADGIATMLYNWNPEALEAFLDPKNKSFELCSRKIISAFIDFVILRKGNAVKARLVVKVGDIYEWDSHVHCEVDYLGAWTHTFGTIYGQSQSLWGKLFGV